MRTYSLSPRGLMIVCLLASGPASAQAPGFDTAPRFTPIPQAPADGFAAREQAEPLKVGGPATEIHGTSATGAPMSLSQFKGKVILLDVSTMWCFFCQQDAPSLQYLYQTYGPKGLAVVTCLTEDTNGAAVTLAGLKQWVATYHLTQAVMNDTSGTGNGVAEQNYVRITGGFPTLVVIDKKFNVQYIQGGLDLSAVTAKIQALLAQ